MNESVGELISNSAASLFGKKADSASLLRTEAGAFDNKLWDLFVESGFPAMLASEASGGHGLDWSDAFPVLRAIGYWQVPLPAAETMIASLLLSLSGLEVPSGPLTIIEQGRGNQLHLAQSGSGHLLSGIAYNVPWARHSSAAVVALRDGRIAQINLDGGARIEHRVNCAGLPSDTLVLDNNRLAAIVPCPLIIAEPAWTLGAMARSAMIVGALEWALEQSVNYARDRVQFGRPIGSNQVIQQSLALMAGDLAAARIAAIVAATDAPASGRYDGRNARFSAAVAKVRSGEAATRGAAIAHQVHGAIGFTQEHPLNFATRRLFSWRDEFGSDACWAGELGRAAIATGGEGFWPAITNRAFAQL